MREARIRGTATVGHAVSRWRAEGKPCAAQLHRSRPRTASALPWQREM